MKQLIQNLRNGNITLAEVPVPQPTSGSVLIKTHHTLISMGTERMLKDFSNSSYIGKALQQPEKVKMVLNKVKTDGFHATYSTIKDKLEREIPIGYCNVGQIIALGNGVTNFQIGDIVVSNGPHSEFVTVPKNLVCRVPQKVEAVDATFTVIGAIALQGLRLAKPTLGECFGVIGLGLVGLITVQLLRANGCSVVGFDIRKDRLEIAKKFGAETVNIKEIEDPKQQIMNITKSRGLDGVIVCTATAQNSPVSDAAKFVRKRGRVILVGTSGLKLDRSEFFSKEISFQVSCSYGPGRYDENYELHGNDYPIGFVRWTENRNFEAFLNLLAEKKLSVGNLISKRYPLETIESAYNDVLDNGDNLGVIIDMPAEPGSSSTETLIPFKENASGHDISVNDKIVIGFIGAGNYASKTLLPAIKKTKAELRTIVSQGGLSSYSSGHKFNFTNNSTDFTSVMKDSCINAVIISTRHNSHATLVSEALKQKKNVFVEKPLCITLDQLEMVKKSHQIAQQTNELAKPILMVGFNRRFSPLIKIAKGLIDAVPVPKALNIVVNSGHVPMDHWTQNPEIGGGRIVGELCHFLDLSRHLIGTRVVGWQKLSMVCDTNDVVSVQLAYECGSISTIHYYSNGHIAIPKERVEIFFSGKIIQINNFIRLRAFGFGKRINKRLWKQNKGQNECIDAFISSVSNSFASPITFSEIEETSKLAIELANEIT